MSKPIIQILNTEPKRYSLPFVLVFFGTHFKKKNNCLASATHQFLKPFLSTYCAPGAESKITKYVPLRIHSFQ